MPEIERYAKIIPNMSAATPMIIRASSILCMVSNSFYIRKYVFFISD